MRNAKEKGTLSLWEIVTATDGITTFIVITNRLIKRTKIRLLTFTCIQKLLQIGIHEWHFTLIKEINHENHNICMYNCTCYW